MHMVAAFLDLYTMIVFGAILISWFQLPPNHPVADVLGRLTEPLLAPIRRFIPPMGGLDFSPIVLLLAVQLLRGALA